MSDPLPYTLAALCYLYDAEGRLLLIHRCEHPNKGLYSPIGGKLHTHEGESPGAAALREVQEEAGVELAPGDLRLAGLVSETAYEGAGHWLLFVYETVRPVAVARTACEEGTLSWHTWEEITGLPIPETDRAVIHPLMRRFRDRFFHVHIDCSNGRMTWRLEEPAEEARP